MCSLLKRMCLLNEMFVVDEMVDFTFFEVEYCCVETFWLGEN